MKVQAAGFRSRHSQDEDAGDLEIINAHAAELNEEAVDVLEYQQDPLKALRGAGQGEGLLDRLLQDRREDRER